MHDEAGPNKGVIHRVQQWCFSLSPLIKPSISASHQDCLSLSALRVPHIAVAPRKIRWVVWDPGEGLTLNADGSAASLGSSGGGIIRDASGYPKLLFSVRFEAGLSNTLAEFSAVLKGLREAAIAGLVISEVQTDSSILADAVNNVISCPWECCYLLRSIRSILGGARVRHILREEIKSRTPWQSRLILQEI